MARFAKILLACALLIPAGRARAQSVPPAAQAAGAAAITAGIVLLGHGNDAATSTTGTGTSAINVVGGPSSPFGHPGTSGNGGALTPGGAAGAGASGMGSSVDFVASGGGVFNLFLGTIIGIATSTTDTTTTTSGTSP